MDAETRWFVYGLVAISIFLPVIFSARMLGADVILILLVVIFPIMPLLAQLFVRKYEDEEN